MYCISKLQSKFLVPIHTRKHTETRLGPRAAGEPAVEKLGWPPFVSASKWAVGRPHAAVPLTKMAASVLPPEGRGIREMSCQPG